ncbi:MAG: hypothetical protein Greene071436_330, partial [Parcubacteria group bacterium Greene0714_36]
GDCNWRHNFNCQPALHPIVAFFFLVGLISLLKSHFNREAKFILAGWLGFLALPAALTRESVPHALRAIGMIPPVMMLAGLGADRVRLFITQWIEKEKTKWPQHARQLGRLRYELFFLFLLTLLVVPLITYHTYFLRWSKHSKTYEAFDTANYHLGIAVEPGTAPDATGVTPAEKTVIAFIDGTDISGIAAARRAFPSFRLQVPGDFVILQNF